MIGEISFLLVSLLGTSFLPGFFFVRMFQWNPLEKLCGSIALSLFLIYLWSFLGYLLGTPIWWAWIATAAALVMGFASRRDLAMLFHNQTLRRAVLGFAVVFAWTLVLLALVRNYSGGGWYGDWYEHYQRTQLFLERLPADTALFGGYLLPARPPLMNLVAAHFLAHSEASFPLFQFTFTYLNLLVFFPLALILPALVKRGGRGIAVLVPLLALNPMLMENATYTWTKLLSAFFVVFGVWLYLAALRKRDPVRMTWAFAVLAAGALVHFAVGPYLVFLAGHYLVLVWPRRARRWAELATFAAIGTIILATWFAWSAYRLGAHATFSSNTSVTSGQRYEGSNLAKAALNLRDTLVPHVLRGASLADFEQESTAGLRRDSWFLTYQGDVVPAMGVIGGLVVLGLLAMALLSPSRRLAGTRERRFWLAFVPICTVLGVAVVGERDHFGLAHVCLPPLVLLGVALVAATFPRLPRLVRTALTAGAAFDFALGIFLQFRLENVAYRAETIVGKTIAGPVGAPGLSRVASANFVIKNGYRLDFLGDHAAPWSSAIQLLVLLGAAAFLVFLLRAAWPRRSPRSHDA